MAAMSRSARISLLLVIDVIFFFIELIVGYAVGSLALVADSFHMLNDVMSLIVALYAIKLTSQSLNDSRYSYGWHRAEILAALINGVFLLALCFSISMEAIERFFSTPEISNPKLIVIVGSFGLASNIFGLFLFHEHGHGHGHGHGDPRPTSAFSSKAPSVIDVPAPSTPIPIPIAQGLDPNATAPDDVSRKAARQARSPTRKSASSDSFSSLYGYPAVTRASLVQAAQEMARSPSPKRHNISGRRHPDLAEIVVTEEQQDGLEADHTPDALEESPLLPSESNMTQKHASNRHTNVHGSMNMRALLLHVFGDALGNVGVIATGLVIWLTEWKYKLYFDPIISLVITIIIFSSALPLVRSASFILLQAVPHSVSPDSVRNEILKVDGVLSLHELHIWQLSESKLIASVHVLASREHDFMPIAKGVRKILHQHGVHSCTIQPEYCSEDSVEDSVDSTSDISCLVRCPADQECDPKEHSCCPPPAIEV